MVRPWDLLMHLFGKKLSMMKWVLLKLIKLGFFDTYSLVSKVTTIRVLISLACVFNLEIHQMDVKTIF